MTLQISDRVRTLAAQAEVEIKEQFAHIDAVAEHNTQRVLAAFQSNRVAESYFAGTTGYGYDDLGRDKLDQIYAELFGTEDWYASALSMAPMPLPPPCSACCGREMC